MKITFKMMKKYLQSFTRKTWNFVNPEKWKPCPLEYDNWSMSGPSGPVQYALILFVFSVHACLCFRSVDLASVLFSQACFLKVFVENIGVCQ